MRLYLDAETFSETSIKFGTYRYTQDCEMLIVTWAVDDGPVQCWDRTERPMPDPLRIALYDCHVVIAHNAMFDRNVLRVNLPDYCPPIEKWRCTMVTAMAHSLPGGLDKLCEILKVPQDVAKHKDGKALIRLFCMPQKFKHNIKRKDCARAAEFVQRKSDAAEAWQGRATRLTHPEEWARFIDYAKADIDAMRAVDARLPNWNYQGAELALWHLDQKINDRGFAVDLDLIDAAIEATAKEQDRLKGEVFEHTNGEVDSATKRDAMLEHILTQYHVTLADLQGSTLERKLDDPDTPDGLKELIRMRLQASTTSTSKYKAVSNGQTGGRMRGTLQFAGAIRTGRWCLAEGSRVPVMSGGVEGVKRIEDVLPSDLVWDGDFWVAHEGVVYSGNKPTISHDGVVATSEHNVYTSTSEHVTLGEAANAGIKLWRGNCARISSL